MRIAVVGAGGLIGSAVAARAAAVGHLVVAIVRPGSDAPAPLSAERIIRLDMARAELEEWKRALAGVDAVVNCVGVLQNSPRESVAVHDAGAARLFETCKMMGIRRVVHFSAVGVDRAQPTRFSASKLAGDQSLMAHDLDWVILRPSVVLGPQAFGASALFRGLASLPVAMEMGRTGELQVVQLDDVAETVVRFLSPEAPVRLTLDLVGPERLTMSGVVARYRRWLGWPPARCLGLPAPVAALLYRCGDLISKLGWRPPVRTTARLEIVRGATGDPARWTEVTGIAPQSLDAALAANPPGVQERWFARLYFLKPAVFIVLAVYWIATGVISLTIGWREGLLLMDRAGAGSLAAPGVTAGALADIIVGCAIAWRPAARLGNWMAIGISAFYLIASTLLVPALWADPLGPLAKILPILVLHFVALAILDER